MEVILYQEEHYRLIDIEFGHMRDTERTISGKEKHFYNFSLKCV